MSQYTTYRIGGPADCLAKPEDIEDIGELLAFGREQHIPVTIIGNGSNLLVSDLGIEGLVIRIGSNMSTHRIEDDVLYAGTGCILSDVARETARLGYRGLQWAAGIPASLGGATYMNAGAFGHNFYENLRQVIAVDREGSQIILSQEELAAGYRNTLLMEKGYIAAEVAVNLQKDDAAKLTAEAEEIMATRRHNQPLNYPSCGSVFKNPEGSHAGYLVEKTGLRGLRVGNVQVSEKHGNFIVNLGGGTAKEVQELLKTVARRVEEEQGYILEPEVRMIGREEEGFVCPNC